jgi:hypothetical protein
VSSEDLPDQKTSIFYWMQGKCPQQLHHPPWYRKQAHLSFELSRLPSSGFRIPEFRRIGKRRDFFDRITSEFRNSETRLTRFSYFLYILNIPGPDLTCKGWVLWLPLPKYSSHNIVLHATRARAGLSILSKKWDFLYSQVT